MKKATFLAVLMALNISLFAQDQGSFDCSDLHERLLAIKNNFDKLPESYKKQATVAFGSQKHYSTNITICNVVGDLMENKSDAKLMLFMNFRYDTANKLNYALRNNHIAVFLEELKKVFGDWDFETESEDHGDLNYYEFREKGYYQSKIKREVTLIKHDYYNDDLSITLEFSRRNY
ncbi:MAG: hypothetical protein ABUT20_65715 [Bacteroidota bacterium]